MSANISAATGPRTKVGATIIVTLCILLVAALSWADRLTGPEICLGGFYIVVIAVTTWFGGPWVGGIVALASGAAWYWNNSFHAGHGSSQAILYWNAGMRLIMFSVTAGITAVAAHRRQEVERTAEDRTIALAAEINERKRAEHELRAERDFAENLIATARAIVLLLDPKGRIVRFNPYFEELSGYSLDEVKGRDWISTFLPADSQEDTRSLFSKAIGGGPTRGNVSPLVTRDGRVLKIEWHDRTLLDAEGRVAGLLCLGQDISERIRAEEEMHWKTALLEAQINATIDGILIVDKEGKKLVQNRRCIELWKIPQHIVDNNDDSEQIEFVKNRTVDPEAFIEKAVYLYSHPDETSHDEVEFKDGTVLDRYSAPVIASDGRYFGRIWIFRDITERRRAEEALQAIIQTSKDWIWAMDAAGVHTFSNAAIEHILGYDPGELTGGAYRGYMHPDDLEAARDAVVRGIAEKRGWSNKVFRWRAKSGDYRFLESNAVPVLGKDGRVVGFRGVDRDVTERRRAEEALKASETRYRRLFESAKDGILILDFETGAIVDVNPFLTELLAFSREQMLGKKVWELGFLHDILPNQANFVELRQKEYIRYEDLPLETADGRRIDVEFVSNVYPVNGRNVIQCNIRDISARKQAEEEIRALAKFPEENPDVVLRVAADGKLLYMNPAARRQLRGWGLGIGSLVPDPLREAAQEALRSESNKMVETEADGRILAFHISAIVESGYANLYARDITERKRAEEARLKLENQLYQAQKMESIGRLAGGVAHDFNNILTGIMGYVQLGLDKLDTDSPVWECLDETRRLAVRAADLTRQLLAFSRRQPLSMEVLNLNDVTDSACGVLKRMLGEDIDLQFVPAPDLGNIRADAGQIEQILMNLAVNARDAMPGGGNLTIETMNVELDANYAARHVGVTPGPYVLLVVSDTGHGMDAATKEHVFDPFFTTKEKGKGTGLGLATVYGIVKQHGGNTWVYSEEGKGTSFKVYLPQVAEEVADVNPQPKPKVATGGETILVVEDETSVRAIAERVLRKHGYAVVTAGSAEEAERVFSEHQNEIALVLTDVVLPGMNGRELCELLTSRNPGLKVLYMSGYADNAIVHHGMLDDGVAFIQKPFTPETIARKVRQVLDS